MFGDLSTIAMQIKKQTNQKPSINQQHVRVKSIQKTINTTAEKADQTDSLQTAITHEPEASQILQPQQTETEEHNPTN